MMTYTTVLWSMAQLDKPNSLNVCLFFMGNFLAVEVTYFLSIFQTANAFDDDTITRL